MNKVLYFIVFVCLFVSACTVQQRRYAIDSALLVTEAQTLKREYASVETTIRQKREVFTDEEWRSLLNVDATIDLLIQRFDAIAQLRTESVSVSDIQFLWGLAVTGYDQARSVISNHWDEFSPSSQILLAQFDKQAEQTSVEMNRLVQDPTTENISKALTLIAGTLNLATKIIGIAGAVL